MTSIATTPKDRAAAAAWILGPLQFICVHLVVERGWPTPYSWAHNNISDLGNTTCGIWDGRYVCSPLHAWMNGAIVLQGVSIVVGVVLAGSALARAGIPRSARVLVGVAGAGWVTAGLVPGDVDEEIHLLGALGVFVAGNLGLILAGLRSRGRTPTSLRLSSLLLAALGTAATALFFSRQYLALGMGGMERVAAYALPVALFAWSLVLLLRRDPSTPAPPAADGGAPGPYALHSRATRS